MVKKGGGQSNESSIGQVKGQTAVQSPASPGYSTSPYIPLPGYSDRTGSPGAGTTVIKYAQDMVRDKTVSKEKARGSGAAKKGFEFTK
jgi:hypothetical protein